MSQELGEFLFLCLWYSFYGIFFWGCASVIFLIATPRAFMKKYFSAPYFREAEIIMLSGFPLFLIRTSMFIRILASPSSGKVRGLSEAYKDAPGWLVAYARILYSSLILVMIWMFGILLFWFSYLVYDKWLT